MKRNRDGEDGLNPTSSNNRSVLESARPGRAGTGAAVRRGAGLRVLGRGLLPQTPAPQDPICLAATGPTPSVLFLSQLLPDPCSAYHKLPWVWPRASVLAWTGSRAAGLGGQALHLGHTAWLHLL